MFNNNETIDYLKKTYKSFAELSRLIALFNAALSTEAKRQEFAQYFKDDIIVSLGLSITIARIKDENKEYYIENFKEQKTSLIISLDRKSDEREYNLANKALSAYLSPTVDSKAILSYCSNSIKTTHKDIAMAIYNFRMEKKQVISLQEEYKYYFIRPIYCFINPKINRAAIIELYSRKKRDPYIVPENVIVLGLSYKDIEWLKKERKIKLE